jgi:hypothetical protein
LFAALVICKSNEGEPIRGNAQHLGDRFVPGRRRARGSPQPWRPRGQATRRRAKAPLEGNSADPTLAAMASRFRRVGTTVALPPALAKRGVHVEPIDTVCVGSVSSTHIGCSAPGAQADRTCHRSRPGRSRLPRARTAVATA